MSTSTIKLVMDACVFDGMCAPSSYDVDAVAVCFASRNIGLGVLSTVPLPRGHALGLHFTCVYKRACLELADPATVRCTKP